MTMGDRVAVMKNGRIQQCALPQGDQPATESDLVPVRIAVYHFPHTVRMLPSQFKPDLELAAARPLARLCAYGGGLRSISFASSITACTRTSPFCSTGSLWSAPSTATRRVGPRAAATDRRLSTGGTMESFVPYTTVIGTATALRTPRPGNGLSATHARAETGSESAHRGEVGER